MECKKDQIYGQLRRLIMDNLLKPGERLPREVELAKELRVAHVTLRHALARLEAEGLVERIRSKGTFVTELARRRSFMILLPDGLENLDTPCRYILAGVESYAEKRALTIEKCPTGLFLSFTPAQRQELKERLHLCGIILETGHCRVEDSLIAAIREMALPVVIPHGLPSDAARSGFLVLRTNERAAIADAYRHLVSRGHRRIAGLFLDLKKEEPNLIRGFSRGELAAFQKENGLDSSDELIAIVPNEESCLRETVSAWMKGKFPPTAIICQSDRIALRVYSILKGMNLSIPEDVSIMGYSNYPGSQLVSPPLTTIDTLLKNCAQLALDKLLNADAWFSPDNTPPEEFTPYQLIERGSILNRK